jgi:hypothetical protein
MHEYTVYLLASVVMIATNRAFWSANMVFLARALVEVLRYSGQQIWSLTLRIIVLAILMLW